MSGYLKSKTIFFFLLILMLSLNTSFLPKPTPWLIFNADPSVIFYPFDDAKVLLFAHTAKHFVHFSFIIASFLIYLKEASRFVICPLTPPLPCVVSAHHMPPHPSLSPGGRGATKKRRHNVTSLPFFMNCGGNVLDESGGIAVLPTREDLLPLNPGGSVVLRTKFAHGLTGTPHLHVAHGLQLLLQTSTVVGF